MWERALSEREKKLLATSFAMINLTKNFMSIFVKILGKMMVATSSNNLGSGKTFPRDFGIFSQAHAWLQLTY